MQLHPHPALPPDSDATPAALPLLPLPSDTQRSPPCLPDDGVCTPYPCAAPLDDDASLTDSTAHTNNSTSLLHRSPATALDGLRFQGCSPLHIAAFCGHMGVVESLMASLPGMAASTNAHGCTPLHFAAHQGHAAVVVCLLANRQSVCLVDGCFVPTVILCDTVSYCAILCDTV